MPRRSPVRFAVETTLVAGPAGLPRGMSYSGSQSSHESATNGLPGTHNPLGSDSLSLSGVLIIQCFLC